MKKNKNNSIKLYQFLSILCLTVLLLGIGYAQISNINLNVSGTASALGQTGIIISDIHYDSCNNMGTDSATIRTYYQNMFSADIELGNDPNSYIRLAVTIDNLTNDKYIFDSYVYDNTDPDFYSNLNIVPSLTGITENSTILDANGTSGDSVTFYITFAYANTSSITDTDLSAIVSFHFTPMVQITYSGLTNSAGNSSEYIRSASYTTMNNTTYNPSVNLGSYSGGITITNSAGTVTLVENTDYTYSNGIVTFSNTLTDDLIISASGGGGISPAAQQIIDNSNPGDTITISTSSSTDPITIGTDGSGTVTTGYVPAEGKYYLLSTDYTGIYSNRPALQETFSIENLSWKVWDKYDNKLLLISTNPTTDQLSLVNYAGYNNGVYFMNSIVDSLYGGATGVTGRSLRMTDIEKKIMEYIDAQSGNHTYTNASGQAIMTESNLIALRKAIDSTYAATSYTVASNSNKRVPVIHGTNSTVNFYTDTSVRKLEDDGTPTTSGYTTRSTVVSTKLWYSATSLTSYLSSSDISLLQSNGSSHWIATRIIQASGTGSFTYGFRRSNGSGGVTNAFIANSGTNGVNVATYPIRPMLEIDLTQANATVENGVIVFS